MTELFLLYLFFIYIGITAHAPVFLIEKGMHETVAIAVGILLLVLPITFDEPLSFFIIPIVCYWTFKIAQSKNKLTSIVSPFVTIFFPFIYFQIAENANFFLGFRLFKEEFFGSEAYESFLIICLIVASGAGIFTLVANRSGIRARLLCVFTKSLSLSFTAIWVLNLFLGAELGLERLFYSAPYLALMITGITLMLAFRKSKDTY